MAPVPKTLENIEFSRVFLLPGNWPEKSKNSLNGSKMGAKRRKNAFLFFELLY